MPVITNERRKLLLAFSIAPLIPALVLLAISLAGHPLEGLWGVALIAPISYVVAVCPGALLYFSLRRFGAASAFGCTAIGILCGAFASLYYMRDSIEHAWADGPQANWAPSVTFAIIASVLGGLSGYVFWRISRPPISPQR